MKLLIHLRARTSLQMGVLFVVNRVSTSCPTNIGCLWPHSHTCFVTGRTTSVSNASIAVVKKPYTVSRRVFHNVRKFISSSDKTLEEGYAPKYRYLPILSGLIVPVCSFNPCKTCPTDFLLCHSYSVLHLAGGTRPYSKCRSNCLKINRPTLM